VLTNPQLFADPESPCIGAFFNCPSGCASQTINTDLLRAYSTTEAFADVDPGLGEALTASIARASERGEGWFGSYWAPTSVLGKYPMVMFEMAAYNAGTYVCLADAACAAPASNNYRAAEVNMIYTAAFAEREPAAAAFLDSVSFTNDVMNAVLAWQEDNGADTSQATGYFAVTYPEVWQAWLTPETAANVTAALSQ
jgi:glycine betaine/proline transport system substrate-binding protein